MISDLTNPNKKPYTSMAVLMEALAELAKDNWDVPTAVTYVRYNDDHTISASGFVGLPDPNLIGSLPMPPGFDGALMVFEGWATVVDPDGVSGKTEVRIITFERRSGPDDEPQSHFVMYTRDVGITHRSGTDVVEQLGGAVQEALAHHVRG